ncbi:MAG TPA: YihY/virulence factor BrkB family protein [Aestuariivirgaceae bacterium]|nr:YihY/virulence factor BrkB family protein [Aestuariivirgaceae bacterium]
MTPRFWPIIIVSMQRLWADEAVSLSGNIAFRTLFSAFPFLIFLTALGAYFGDEDLANGLIQFMFSVGPEEIIEPLAKEVNLILTTPRTDLVSIGFLITIWAAMAGVDSVRIGLNRAYNVRDRRSAWKLYGWSIVFVIGTAIVLLSLSVLIVAAPVLMAFVQRHAPELDEFVAVFSLVRYPVAILLLTGALTAAHIFLPAKRLRLLQVLPGVILTVVVWVVLATAYSYYLANFANFASYYAGLSGVFAALFFLYLAAIVLLLGGEVNRVIMVRTQSPGTGPP